MGRTASVIKHVLGIAALQKTLQVGKAITWDANAKNGFYFLRDEIRRLGRKKGNGKVETFHSACTRLGLTNDELQERRQALGFQASMMRVFGYVSLIGTLYAAIMSENFLWFMLFIAQGLAICTLFFGLAFAKSFRVWQIDSQKLGSCKEFIDEGGIYKIFAG